MTIIEILTVGLVLEIIVIFVPAIYFIIRQQRQREVETTEAALAAGFTRPVSSLSQIEGRILWLFQNKRRTKLTINNIWQKSFPDGKIVLFDLKDTSSEAVTEIAKQDVLLTSPYLQIPRFTLTPRPRFATKASGWSKRLLDWAACLNIKQRMDSLGHAEFDARYWVSTEAPPMVRIFLTHDRLEHLARLPEMRLEAAADMFSLTPLPYTQFPWNRSGAEQQTIQQKVQLAMQLFQIFSGSAASDDNRTPGPDMTTEQLEHRSHSLLPIDGPLPAGSVCPKCGAPLSAPNEAAEQNCPYCGAAVPVFPNCPQLLDDNDDGMWGRLNDETWLHLASANRTFTKIKRVEAVVLGLPIAVALMLASAYISVLLIGSYYKDLRTYQLLSVEGVSTNAIVTNLIVNRDNDGVASYDVHYTYRARSQTFTGKESVSKTLFSHLSEGQSLRIVYASSGPEKSALVDDFEPPGLMMPLFGICIGLLLLFFDIRWVRKIIVEITSKS